MEIWLVLHTLEAQWKQSECPERGREFAQAATCLCQLAKWPWYIKKCHLQQGKQHICVFSIIPHSLPISQCPPANHDNPFSKWTSTNLIWYEQKNRKCFLLFITFGLYKFFLECKVSITVSSLCKKKLFNFLFGFSLQGCQSAFVQVEMGSDFFFQEMEIYWGCTIWDVLEM